MLHFLGRTCSGSKNSLSMCLINHSNALCLPLLYAGRIGRSYSDRCLQILTGLLGLKQDHITSGKNISSTTPRHTVQYTHKQLHALRAGFLLFHHTFCLSTLLLPFSAVVQTMRDLVWVCPQCSDTVCLALEGCEETLQDIQVRSCHTYILGKKKQYHAINEYVL